MRRLGRHEGVLRAAREHARRGARDETPAQAAATARAAQATRGTQRVFWLSPTAVMTYETHCKRVR